jgi:hypothetical protein
MFDRFGGLVNFDFIATFYDENAVQDSTNEPV